MDQTLVNLYRELYVQSKSVLLVENPKWATYVRGEFAQLRSVVNKIEEREKQINVKIHEMRNKK